MKKTIIIEILCLIAFCIILACAIKFLSYAHEVSLNIIELQKELVYDSSYERIIDSVKEYRTVALSYGIPALLAALATLAAMVLIALKDFPVFKPMLDKLAAKRADRKQANDTAKAEKAAAEKQARIERLQSELDALKKDE